MLDMIGSRLKQIRTDAKLTQPAFAAIAGTSKQYVSQLESGRNQTPTPVYVERWARHFGISVRWIVSGDGPMRQSAAQSDDWADVHATTQRVGLGAGVEAEDYAETHKLKFKRSSLARKRLKADRLEVAYGHGESMLPRVHDGDAVLFDTSDTTPRDGHMYVICVEGRGDRPEPQVKRCLTIGDLTFFAADNPSAAPEWSKPRRIDDPRKTIRVLGRVRWIGSWED